MIRQEGADLGIRAVCFEAEFFLPSSDLSFLTVVMLAPEGYYDSARKLNASAKKPKVLLVDDHPAVVEHVARLLWDEFEIVGMLSEGRDLLRAVNLHHPELLVLDITLPDGSGIDLARKVVATPSPPKIVFLTVHADSDYLEEALSAGGTGYVVKSRLASDLIPSLRSALAGKRFISPHRALTGGWTDTPASEGKRD